MSSQAYRFVDAGVTAIILKEFDQRDFGGSSSALAEWLNKRWRKTGYQIDADVVHQVLIFNGREASADMGDMMDDAESNPYYGVCEFSAS
ncbi:hypothetical protein B0J12DRAFT_735983 [Macrophomina phaseolina]|uniref:Uncharacterized protein n=1 Tax=Macrophomina phaseolina TaxID=35725 RepID=A0ABQ8GTM7_9PEZI|nr:hypothetical protein B0J12DRAFT_735983 [Macrophomina phaseolina]